MPASLIRAFVVCCLASVLPLIPSLQQASVALNSRLVYGLAGNRAQISKLYTVNSPLIKN